MLICYINIQCNLIKGRQVVLLSVNKVSNETYYAIMDVLNLN